MYVYARKLKFLPPKCIIEKGEYLGVILYDGVYIWFKVRNINKL